MNTTPTRMVYDRYNKATIAKYSRSISHNTHSYRQGNSRKGTSPFPTSKHTIKPIKVLMRCAVALFTRNAVRRGVLHSPEERRGVIHH